MTAGADLGVVDAAAAVRSGEVTPRELLDAACERITDWEPHVHALVSEVLAEAHSVVAQRSEQAARGEFVGPLHGVPIILKDLIDMQGVPTTASSKILENNIAAADAPLVTRLREAGAVLMAKANTHEFAYGALTPPTRNPWDTSRMPGGSSGGSAAAVATGMCAGALGSDTAGSIREPAALCGLVGHKPTFGLVDLDGVVPLAWSLDTVGPLCRSVADARLLLSVIAGADIDGGDIDRGDIDGGDIDGGAEPGSASRRRSPEAFSGARVAVASELMTPNQPEVDTELHRVLGAMEQAGAQIDEVSIGDPEELIAAEFVILTVEASAYHREWIETRIDDYQPDVRAYLLMGLEFSGVDYVDAQRYRRVARSRVDAAFADHDFVFAPSHHVLAPSPHADTVTFGDSDDAVAPRDLTLIRPLSPFNLTGHCGVSVPTGHASGLPLGVQLVGPAFGDGPLLDWAQALQNLLGWSWTPPTLKNNP